MESVQTDPCSPRVIVSSAAACPVLSLHTLWRFFESYYFVFGMIMMVAGVWLMIYGGRVFKATFFLAGMTATAAFLLVIMFAGVYPDDIPYWAVWLNLVVALGIGSGIGYAAAKWSRIGVLFIGSMIGGLFGGLLYSSFFYIFAQNNPLLAVWLTISFSAIVVAVLSMVFFDQAVIICSSLGGAYAFVRVLRTS